MLVVLRRFDDTLPEGEHNIGQGLQHKYVKAKKKKMAFASTFFTSALRGIGLWLKLLAHKM